MPTPANDPFATGVPAVPDDATPAIEEPPYNPFAEDAAPELENAPEPPAMPQQQTQPELLQEMQEPPPADITAPF